MSLVSNPDLQVFKAISLLVCGTITWIYYAIWYYRRDKKYKQEIKKLHQEFITSLLRYGVLASYLRELKENE